jgi:hypothetical protein
MPRSVSATATPGKSGPCIFIGYRQGRSAHRAPAAVTPLQVHGWEALAAATTLLQVHGWELPFAEPRLGSQA